MEKREGRPEKERLRIKEKDRGRTQNEVDVEVGRREENKERAGGGI